MWLRKHSDEATSCKLSVCQSTLAFPGKFFGLRQVALKDFRHMHFLMAWLSQPDPGKPSLALHMISLLIIIIHSARFHVCSVCVR
jgi:hypothetical protein